MSEGQSYKVVFVGDMKVGKTSIINYRIKRDASSTTSTLGATSTKIEVVWEGTPVQMMVWDTAGQESFRNLVPVYARGSQAAVVVFDQSEKTSWDNVNGWYDYLAYVEGLSDLIVVLVANKKDKEEVVDMNEVYTWSNGKGIEMVRTAAIDGTGVDLVFETLAKALMAKEEEKKKAVEEKKRPAPAAEPKPVDVAQKPKEKKKGCC